MIKRKNRKQENNNLEYFNELVQKLSNKEIEISQNHEHIIDIENQAIAEHEKGEILRKEAKELISQVKSWLKEYGDYIDLSKLLQLVPGIGAFVGAYVNNKLVDKLGEYAMYAYRMRILYDSDEVCVTKNKNWLNKLFRK